MDTMPPCNPHTEALGDYVSLADALGQIATKVHMTTAPARCSQSFDRQPTRLGKAPMRRRHTKCHEEDFPMHNATSNSVRIPIPGSFTAIELKNAERHVVTVRHHYTTVTVSPLATVSSPVAEYADLEDSSVADRASCLDSQKPDWSLEEKEKKFCRFPKDQYQSNGAEDFTVYHEDKPHPMGTPWSETGEPAHLGTYTLKIPPLCGKTADQLSDEVAQQFDVLASWTDNGGQLYCRCYPGESPWLDDDSYVAAYAVEWLPVIRRRLHKIGVETFDIRFDLYA